MKNTTTLIIGGCRSGKSSHALDMANQMPGTKKIFVATSVPSDPEMEKRVMKHKQDRGDLWETAEVPMDLAAAVSRLSKEADVLLVDCLTLWLSNLLAKGHGEEEVFQACKELIHALETAVCPVILVSNEVGSGIVPENEIARQFRDLAGFVNQQIAASATSVIWSVAGIPISIKKG